MDFTGYEVTFCTRHFRMEWGNCSATPMLCACLLVWFTHGCNNLLLRVFMEKRFCFENCVSIYLRLKRAIWYVNRYEQYIVRFYINKDLYVFTKIGLERRMLFLVIRIQFFREFIENWLMDKTWLLFANLVF